MGDKYSPVACDSCVKSVCGANCDQQTTVSFQGSYQNDCCTNVAPQAAVVIAQLSNKKSECQADIAVTLNPICLSWCDFLLLFYRANNTFSILPAGSNSCAVSFAGQTYEDTTNQYLRLNLSQLIRQAWVNKCQGTVTNIPTRTSLLLNKQTSYIKSLIQSDFTLSLSLDQAIATLLNNNEIAPADVGTSAKVAFTIEYLYYFEPLGVAAQINFVYVTNIPCYKNLSYCDNWCPQYSPVIGKTCATCPTSDSKQVVMNMDDDDFAKDLNELNLKMNNDDQSVVSKDSSKW